MRVMCGGQVIEDITGYNRVREMISRLQPTGGHNDNLIWGFGNNFYAEADEIKARPGIILHQRVSFKPLCGILTQNKLIPLKQGNLTI